MPRPSHPQRVKERAKVLREQGLSFRAIALQLEKEIGEDAPGYWSVWKWSKGWEADKSGGGIAQ